jgi:hypothetical protein
MVNKRLSLSKIEYGRHVGIISLPTVTNDPVAEARELLKKVVSGHPVTLESETCMVTISRWDYNSIYRVDVI